MSGLPAVFLRIVCLATLCAAPAVPALVQAPVAAGPADEGKVTELVSALEKLGVHLDPKHALCAIDVRVGIRDDLLEYLLVSPRGQSHESLFVTDVAPRAVNTALLALGAQPGTNVRIVAKDPPPTPEELRDGAPAYDVEPPSGDGFYLYAGWREAGRPSSTGSRISSAISRAGAACGVTAGSSSARRRHRTRSTPGRRSSRPRSRATS